MAPTTVIVSTTPTIRSTSPRMTATNRPVAATIPITSFQMAQNGQRYRGFSFFQILAHFQSFLPLLVIYASIRIRLHEGISPRITTLAALGSLCIQVVRVVGVLAGLPHAMCISRLSGQSQWH